VYQRADGRWVASLEVGMNRDGRRRRPRAVRRTKREALAALDELRRQVDQGVTPERTQSVGDFLEWWLATVVPDTVKPSTLDGYERIVKLYITPHVGPVKLAKLSPQHVKSMLRALEDDGLSTRTRQYARAVLRRALRWAEKHGLVVRNVAALVDGPRRSGTKLDDTLDAAGAAAMIEAAAGDRLEALAVIVLRLGLRKGEALALRWDDVDLDAGTLAVRGTLKRRRDGQRRRSSSRQGAQRRLDRPPTAEARQTRSVSTGPYGRARCWRRHPRRIAPPPGTLVVAASTRAAGDTVATCPQSIPVQSGGRSRLVATATASSRRSTRGHSRICRASRMAIDASLVQPRSKRWSRHASGLSGRWSRRRTGFRLWCANASTTHSACSRWEDHPPSVVLFWKGPPPPPVRHLVDELHSTVRVVVRHAEYSETELIEESRRVMALGQSQVDVQIWSVGPLNDCSGLRVEIDETTDRALAERVITSRMKLEFSVGGGQIILT
jgi:hypothetical protein